MIERAARYFSGRVARRLFLLFVLSAFVPLAVLALLSYFQSRDMLLQQGEQRLAATAKGYGMALYERLLLLSELAASSGGSAQPLAQGSMAQRSFKALARVAPDGRVTPLFGAAPQLPGSEGRARLAQGRPVLTIDPRRAGVELTLAVPLTEGSGFTIATLAADAFWQSEMRPAATEFCVVEEGTRARLACPPQVPEEQLRAAAAPASQSALWSANWAQDGEARRGVAWPHFMGPSFGTRDWIVIASQPEAFLLARLMEFQRIYVPVVALALLLASWLTVRQSRSIVEPVTRLAERARGIEGNDFGARLVLDRRDEFGELASAFNRMSSRLGRQFAALTALSEIDQLILSTLDTPQVVRTVLQRLADVVPADFVGITLCDFGASGPAHSYYRDLGANEGVGSLAMIMNPEDLALANANRDGAWIDLERHAPRFLVRMSERGARFAYLQPIVWRQETCGALALGFRERPAALDEDRRQVREFADRVAVAVSSARRDEMLYQQAHFDSLTGLPNRLLFKDRLGQEIARSQREDRRFAVLFIDIDRFKTVNDTLGHSAGDAVLCEAARRIAGCVRDSDTVSRLGGDEFTVLLGSLGHPQDAARVADQVVTALSGAFEAGGSRSFLSASIGIAAYPGDGATPEELLKNADTAMYRAKAGGRAMTVFFEERMNADAMARVTLDRDLREAIDRGELSMHFQPMLHLRSGEIRGAEALVRWHHPERGEIAPVRFIPVAEESGFIEHIGRFALEHACVRMAGWKAQGLPLRRVCVNVSPRQLRNTAILETIRDCALRAGVGLDCLELEITEGLLIDRPDSVEGLLRELHGAGLRIALDDFGTGFSSMAYLNRFPINTIKIDRVFVAGLGSSRDAEAIVVAIIAMSHALGKTVVAEGVETREQLEILRGLGCDEVQGYHVSWPLPSAAFADFVRSHADASRAPGPGSPPL